MQSPSVRMPHGVSRLHRKILNRIIDPDPGPINQVTHNNEKKLRRRQYSSRQTDNHPVASLPYRLMNLSIIHEMARRSLRAHRCQATSRPTTYRNHICVAKLIFTAAIRRNLAVFMTSNPYLRCIQSNNVQ